MVAMIKKLMHLHSHSIFAYVCTCTYVHHIYVCYSAERTDMTCKVRYVRSAD